MKVDDIRDNATRCLCPDCPVYSLCMGRADEKLYCARGATECDTGKGSCICPDCSVYVDYELDKLYFCRTGAAG